MAHTIYENEVLSNKVNEILKTKTDLNPYMTIDNSLAEAAGRKKVVNVYTGTGNVEALEMGEGNTEEITVSFEKQEYPVLTYQGYFNYHDEEEDTDPMIVDVGVETASKQLINKFNDLAIAEFGKADPALDTPAAAWSFDVVVDAIAKFGETQPEFLLINPKSLAAFRKALKDMLSYSEGFARTGYVGSVAGVPVVVSNIVPENEGYMGTKEAVTLFVKRDTEVETERDANKRNNKYFIRKVATVALTNKAKAYKIVIGG